MPDTDEVVTWEHFRALKEKLEREDPGLKRRFGEEYTRTWKKTYRLMIKIYEQRQELRGQLLKTANEYIERLYGKNE